MANRFIQHSPLVTAVVLITFFASGWSYANVYKWVDEEGRVHYGDTPPPQANAAHSLLNSRGLRIGGVKRAKTKQQLAKEAQILDEQRLQRLEQQSERNRDKVLLLTFTTERDLLLTRDDRLTAIDGAIMLSQRRIDGWNARLVKLDTQVEAYESTDKIPEKLQNNRDQLYRRITSSKNYMSDKLEERKRTSDQFEADLTRYRELKKDG